MQIKNDKDSYGVISIILHWIIGLTIIAMIPFGWYMEDMEVTPDKFKFYALHKSIGITVLVLVAFRIFWRSYSGAPQAMNTHKKWERIVSKSAHILLYIAMVVMPMSGWLMSSASGFPVSVFGLFTLPDLIDKDPSLAKILNPMHSVAAWTIIVLVCLHVLGALKHHFIDKDGTLRRMLPSFIVLVLSIIMPLSAQAQNIQKWDIIDDKSRIAFTALWETAKVEGIFHQFDGDIAFDKDDLENSYARIIINMASFDTGYAERDVEIESQYWFDVENYSNARFETTSISKREEAYFAEGKLTIKDVEKEISFPFTLENQEDNKVYMSAELDLKRSDFNIGLGRWRKTDVIADDVKVKIDLAVMPKDKVE